MQVKAAIFGLWIMALPAAAQEAQDWNIHGQTTLVWQYHPAFRSPYRGTNSLDPGSRGDETINATAFLGLRLWDGGEVYADPEIDQGFGISNTLGVAGYVNGDGSKVGSATPYFRLQRLFFRQTFDLGGDEQDLESDENQLAGKRTSDNLIITLGKFSAVDIFDNNSLAHDTKHDFLNWAIIDSAAYDYAADAWGYTYGATAEWTQGWWTLRAGLLDMSRLPNGTALVRGFGNFEIITEGEARYTLAGRAGTFRLLGYNNRAPMGSYEDAVLFGIATHSAPDTALVRHYRSRPGAAMNVEQEIGDGLSAFLRASLNDGSQETYEFTEINRSLALGLSLKGSGWGRNDDTVGLAVEESALSRTARAYFAAGGLGVLIGDGTLPHYQDENIVEAYYNYSLGYGLAASLDYQWIGNPAYNADRGPVSVFGLRLHWEG